MRVFSEERAYIIAAADELEDYLLSGAANWRLTGSESFPPLSPGYVLFFIQHLKGISAVDREYEQIQKALDKIDTVRQQWKMAWKNRVDQEIPQRMRLWSNYLNELDQTRNLAHPEYRWSVRWRVILALLIKEIDHPDQEISQRMYALDEQLRALSEPGAFIWDKRLEGNFSRTDFWFLYLKMSKSS